jgi:hypothetical protein
MAVRVFWMAVGAGAGIWATRKLKDKAQKYAPEAVADNVTGIAEAIRYFADEVRAGMAEREQELYRAIGVDVAEPAVIEAPPPYRVLTDGPRRPVRRALPRAIGGSREIAGTAYHPHDHHPHDGKTVHDRRDGR